MVVIDGIEGYIDRVEPLYGVLPKYINIHLLILSRLYLLILVHLILLRIARRKKLILARKQRLKK